MTKTYDPRDDKTLMDAKAPVGSVARNRYERKQHATEMIAKAFAKQQRKAAIRAARGGK